MSEVSRSPWPSPIQPEALHGLAGDFVKLVEPHTESDPVALLIQLLVAFGNVIGRNAYFPIEADRHFMNIFAVATGDSSKGRKGTSWGYISRLFDGIDTDWKSSCVKSGLSSGEGLMWSVRDPIEKSERTSSGTEGEFQSVIADPGVSDKRLLVLETEFASVLKVLERDGNKLSAVIRDAWDRGELRSLTKNEAAKATNTHISIVGHITRTELLRYLKQTETANGFGNRFLWFCVRRSKLLPFGGQVPQDGFDALSSRLRQAVEFGKGAGALSFDDAARSIWSDLYGRLAREKPGVTGAMTARAEPQILRLASIYALLDQSRVVRQEHLMAGVAVWEYCEESCRFIFGDKTGDPIADQILDELRARSSGLTKTEIIEDVFQRHKKSSDIERALQALQQFRLVEVIFEEGEGGRRRQRWHLADRNPASSEFGEFSNETSQNSHLAASLGAACT